VLGSWACNEDLGLPRTLCDVLNAIQHQVLQLDVPAPNTPRFVIDILLLVKLSHRCITLAKNVFDPTRVAAFTCLYERIRNLCDLEREL
jgi:hypothetical protein